MILETAVRMLKNWMGIADHAKKAENSEDIAEVKWVIGKMAAV